MTNVSTAGSYIPSAASWFTITIWSGRPVTVTVIIADRGALLELAWYVAVIEPFPFPEEVTKHHVWSLDAVQFVLDVTLKFVIPAACDTFCAEGVTVSVGAAPAWVTVTITSETPDAVIVTVATLCVVDAFWLYVTVIVPFPVPEGVQEHQDMLQFAFQLVFEVTVKLVLPAADDTF